MSINPALYENYKGSKGHAELCELLDTHQSQSNNESAQSVRIHSEPIPSLISYWQEAQDNFQRLKNLYHERDAQYKKEDSERWSSFMDQHKAYMKNPSFDATPPENDDEAWGVYTQKHYDLQIELWEQVMHYQLLRQDYETHKIHEEMHHLL